MEEEADEEQEEGGKNTEEGNGTVESVQNSLSDACSLPKNVLHQGEGILYCLHHIFQGNIVVFFFFLFVFFHSFNRFQLLPLWLKYVLILIYFYVYNC